MDLISAIDRIQGAQTKGSDETPLERCQPSAEQTKRERSMRAGSETALLSDAGAEPRLPKGRKE